MASNRVIGEFEFRCSGYETNYSWGHEVELYVHGVRVLKTRKRYYNRTWEAYEYQSVMRDALARYKDAMLAEILTKHKIENGLERLSAKRKKQLTEEFKQTADYKELVEVSVCIENGEYKEVM